MCVEVPGRLPGWRYSCPRGCASNFMHLSGPWPSNMSIKFLVFSEQELWATIGKDTEKKEATISYTDLAAFPPFVRFDEISIFVQCSGTPNQQLCEWIETYLQTLKPTLNGLKRIYFAANVKRRSSCDFESASQLIEYLSNKLLPILGSSCCYEFSIGVSRWFYNTKYLKSF